MSKPDFSLIETMRYEPGEGIALLSLHMQRLANSAEVLGLSGAESAEAALDAYISTLEVDETTMFRLRLALQPDGEIVISSAPFALQTAETVWRVAVAKTGLASGDPLSRHKTTRRAVYEAARAEYPVSDVDEVILLNEKGELCEGTITSLFVEDASGVLLTPPLEAGCLDGVLRRSLILEGKAVEQVLRPDDLSRRTLYVGNSLRGLIRAEGLAGIEARA